MTIRFLLACLFFFSVSYADDIYFKIGYVIRNVQVIDTTNDRINIVRDGRYLAFDTEGVFKVVRLEVLPGQKSVYEMFSKELADQHWERKEQQEILRALERQCSWNNSVYIAGGGGIPQGARFELGYNFGVHFGFAFSFGIGDDWSGDPGEGTVAFLGILRFPIQSFPITPYFMLCRGGNIRLFGGGSDDYTLISLGTMIEFRKGLHFRPEFGLIITSKHISGGQALFGTGTNPEIRESNLRIGLNLTLEIDLAYL